MKKYILLLLLPVLAFVAGSNITKLSESKYTPSNNLDIKAATLPYNNSTDTGEIKEFTLTAKPTTIQFNDNDSFETWAYNGQVPGPELRVQKGDTVKINFTNNLPQATTIHFHGIRVPNDMDGVPDVTQTPIKPGEKFVYEFVALDAGTYWYHPHVRGNEQVERGLYGTIVVEDPIEPNYSQDLILVIDDWRLRENGDLDENFNNMHDITHDGRWGNFITVNGESNPKINLKQSERVRLRLVNTSNARVYKLDLGKLNARAFAVDGILAQEVFDADNFELAPGNRIDLDIAAPSGPGEYLIRDNFTRYTNNLFTVIVSEESTEETTFDTPRAMSYPDMSFTNYTVDQEYSLDQGRGAMHNIEATINGKAYPNYVETSLKENRFQVIRFSNDSARIHPMHLHGQFFKVMARNGQIVDEPYIRDTVLVHSQETVDVGLIPIDKGSWALHCHALEHAEAGMMTVVDVI